MSELMGKDASENLTLEDLPKLLGEKMPEITHDRIGRIRLVNALTQRFGPSYKNLPGIAKLVEQFDRQVGLNNIIRMNKRSK